MTLFLVISLLPMMIMVYWSFHNTKDYMQQYRIDHLETIADLKIKMIETFFHEKKLDIKTTQDYFNIKSNLPIVTQYAGDRTNPAYITAKNVLDRQLKVFIDTYGYRDIMLLNVEGKVVYTAKEVDGEEAVLGNSLPDYGGKAFEEGKKDIFLSDVFVSQREGYPFGMLITAPADDIDDKFIGVIALEVNLAPIFEFIQDTTGLGKTGETLVGKKYGDKVLFLNPLRHDPDAALNLRISVLSEHALPMIRGTSGQDGIIETTDYRPEKVLAVYRHIPVCDWGFVSKIDIEEELESVYVLERRCFI